MTNEIMTVDIDKIEVQQGTIIFSEFDSVLGQAQELAEQINKVEVTEDNVQFSKKMLAAVNKRVKEMEDKRIAIKKEMLLPYNEFERQVKMITDIVKQADKKVRDQVKEMEEQEREVKQIVLETLFNRRISQYSFKEMFKFDDFIKPSHLNKSTTEKSVEEEMVQWLEQIDSDLKAINHLPNAYEIMTEYYDTKDLTVAIRIVNDRNERKKELSKMVEVKKVEVITHTPIQLLNDLYDEVQAMRETGDSDLRTVLHLIDDVITKLKSTT